MTDGGCWHPEKAIKELKENKELIAKLEFRGIMQGDDESGLSTLTKIIKEMDGSMQHCINVEKLRDEFIKLVPNIYNQK